MRRRVERGDQIAGELLAWIGGTTTKRFGMERLSGRGAQVVLANGCNSGASSSAAAIIFIICGDAPGTRCGPPFDQRRKWPGFQFVRPRGEYAGSAGAPALAWNCARAVCLSNFAKTVFRKWFSKTGFSQTEAVSRQRKPKSGGLGLKRRRQDTAAAIQQKAERIWLQENGEREKLEAVEKPAQVEPVSKCDRGNEAGSVQFAGVHHAHRRAVRMRALMWVSYVHDLAAADRQEIDLAPPRLDEAEAEVVSLLGRIGAREFDPRPGPVCQRCDVKPICRFAAR